MNKRLKLNPFLEKSPYEADGGNLIGRDPRSIPKEQWLENQNEFPIGLKAIRANCIDCCCYQVSEVRKCVCTHCPLWPFRLGFVPKGYREAIEQKKRGHKAVSKP